MSYTALYRKLRPKKFNDVIGQAHIIRTLLNQINSDKVSHAYLFCGTRGTGKTSTAKIFARAVNCQNNNEGEPCNTCNSCLAILENRSMNVIEIDAASNNGVDNIRDINEEVKYSPTEGIYKVYIIDEVHMLSIGAFNALLKTLEEPPQHVIFILATTDPQKIPSTIHSRCQRFEFKRITTEDMVTNIKEFMINENVQVEEKALRYIAQISDGAMRDALSILDQSISFYYNEVITIDKVLNIVGSVDNTILFSLTDALINYDSSKCMEIIETLIVDGRDINNFVSDLITHFRNLLVSVSVGNINTKALDLSEDNINKLIQQGKNIDSMIIIDYINIFSNLQSKLKFDKNARILLETTCIKLCNPQILETNESLNSRIAKLEKMIETGTVTKQVEVQAVKTVPKKIIKKAVPDDITNVIASWKLFVSRFNELVRGLLELSFPGYLDGDILYIVANDISSTNLLKMKEDLIREELIKMFSKDFAIKFISKKEYNQRHTELFGVKDENITDFNEEAIKEKINMDITFK